MQIPRVSLGTAISREYRLALGYGIRPNGSSVLLAGLSPFPLRPSAKPPQDAQAPEHPEQGSLILCQHLLIRAALGNSGAQLATFNWQDAEAEYSESKEHNKGAAKGHAVSAMDEAKAGMSHAKDQVASKFTKNKAEADDKVHCRVVSS